MAITVEIDVDSNGQIYVRVPQQRGVSNREALAAGARIKAALQLENDIPIKFISEPEQHVHAPNPSKTTTHGHAG